MPIYEYECVACGHKLEAIQKVNDVPLMDCPECEESQLRKLVSAAGFRLKGGGWYETDFKSGGRKNVSDGGGSAADGGKSAADGGKSAADGGKSAADGGKSAASGKGSACGTDDCCPVAK